MQTNNIHPFSVAVLMLTKDKNTLSNFLKIVNTQDDADAVTQPIVEAWEDHKVELESYGDFIKTIDTFCKVGLPVKNLKYILSINLGIHARELAPERTLEIDEEYNPDIVCV